MGDHLAITVLGAKELESKNFRKQSPYVEIRVGDDVQSTSVARHEDTDPQWDQTFLFFSGAEG